MRSNLLSVTNFNFSPDTDGTYNVSITISSGNELQMWMPLKQASQTGKIARGSNEKVVPYLQWLNKLAADINLPKLIETNSFKKKTGTKYELEKEFFNWGIINKDEKDTNYSKDSYISFRLIFEIYNYRKINISYQQIENIKDLLEFYLSGDIKTMSNGDENEIEYFNYLKQLSLLGKK